MDLSILMSVGAKDSPAVTSDETPLWASCDLISLLKSVPAIEMPTTPPTNCAKVTSAVAWGMSLGRLWNAAEEEERSKGSVLPKQPQKKSKRGKTDLERQRCWSGKPCRFRLQRGSERR